MFVGLFFLWKMHEKLFLKKKTEKTFLDSLLMHKRVVPAETRDAEPCVMSPRDVCLCQALDQHLQMLCQVFVPH